MSNTNADFLMPAFLRKGAACAAGAAILGVAATGSTVQAQWTVRNLHPTFATQSIAYGVSNDHQVGYIIIDGRDRAAVCTGGAQSWLLLDPPLTTESRAWGVHQNEQAW